MLFAAPVFLLGLWWLRIDGIAGLLSGR